jgi:diaminohydroxyphosphoribosylaminopyrimidine deaminase / 5-amino-6-(5-phosphoribosylamino)uracil reductase
MDQSALMSRADDLSKLGLGYTAPNPIVGCIIVDSKGNVIAEEFHNGGAHAESKAINSLSAIPSDATLLTTLEPCNHHGKTEPCSDLIIKSGIKNVVFSIADPNPIAQGGSKKLRDAGVKVTGGVLTEKVEFTNRYWLQKIKTGRPYFTWKIAMTLDGKIAASDRTSKWITSMESRSEVSKLRAQADAVLIGTGTALADNPSLNSHNPGTRQPLRIVMGKSEIPTSHKLNDDSAATHFLKSHEVSDLLDLLLELEVNHVLVESGPKLGTVLIKNGLIDEIAAYIAPSILGTGNSFVGDLDISTLSERIDYQIHSFTKLGNDLSVTLVGKK